MEFKNIVPGMTFEKEFIVEEGDTASHFGNDKVPVFASPRLRHSNRHSCSFPAGRLGNRRHNLRSCTPCRNTRWHEGARGNRGDRGEGQDADLLCKGV